MDIKQVGFESNIKEDTSWLKEPKLLDKLPGNLSKTSGDTVDCSHVCDVLNSKLLREVKYENTKYLDEATVSEDLDPLNIEVKDVDNKYSLLSPFAVKDSCGRSLEMEGESPAVNKSSLREERQTVSSRYRYVLLFK